jgi:prepilin-type N-terminal cleavage/methylation domain-containing protein
MKTPNQKAFTLIELLVVISIIAILAGIALPAFTAVQTKGAQTKALSNAKQIGMACKLFAGDYNGNFPLYTNVANKTLAANGSASNDVLQTLMPDYLPDKSIFAIPKSAFCRNAGTASTGNDAILLNALENEWAYVLGLTDTSNSQWPLIASGFAAPAAGTYIDDETAQGGIWRNKAAIVIRCDISGKVEKLVGTTTKVVPRSDSDPTNAFVYQAAAGNVPAWLGSGTSVLNPR